MPQELVGVVPVGGRGTLPFALLHGEPLHVHAARAVAAVVDVPVVLASTPDLDTVRQDVAAAGLRVEVVAPHALPGVVRRARAVLVHDPLCPLVPARFLAEVVARAGDGVSLAAYRPVTDTVKTAVDGRIEGTIDREALAALTSPVLVCGGCDEAPLLADVTTLLRWLRARGRVELVAAPAMARRVDDESAVHLLECVDELAHRVRGGSAGLSGAGRSAAP